MSSHYTRPALHCHQRQGDAGNHSLLWRSIEHAADHRFAREPHQNWLAEIAKGLESREQLKVLLSCFAKAKTRIDNHPIKIDANRTQISQTLA